MKIKHLIQDKQAALIGISILSGMFVTSEEMYDCLELSRLKEIQPGTGSLLLLVFQAFFFISFSWILLKINTDWQPGGKRALKQFIASSLIAILFCLIVWQGVSPFIQSMNEEIRDQYEQITQNDTQGKRPDRKKEGGRRNDYHFHGKKLFYLFHEPEEAWYNNLLTLSVVIFTLSRVYLLHRQKEEVERSFEKLQNESMQSQLNALQNQINPHFFFNALNSLHALIAEGEKQKSISYLTNLSNVFRYILQSEKKGLVALAEELSFLEIYRFMLSVKYEEKLQFDIDVASEYTSYQVPVLSLLPLLENVIKHNEISMRHPMTISIHSTNEPTLIIQNPIQPKLDEVDKVGIGLKNLSNRFILLSHQEIRIENTPEYFRVILPLQTPNTPMLS